jgi:hypothetical protein
VAELARGNLLQIFERLLPQAVSNEASDRIQSVSGSFFRLSGRCARQLNLLDRFGGGFFRLSGRCARLLNLLDRFGGGLEPTTTMQCLSILQPNTNSGRITRSLSFPRI